MFLEKKSHFFVFVFAAAGKTLMGVKAEVIRLAQKLPDMITGHAVYSMASYSPYFRQRGGPRS